MNKKSVVIVCFLFILIAQELKAQNPVNWTKEQLKDPSELFTTIKSEKNIPLIFSIGPGPLIPHATDIGMVKDKENINKLREQLSKFPKDKEIVVYCGCCPYEHCPNVRPAIQLLKDMKFTNYKLLDLPHNIKVDWINKGYPTKE